MALFDRLKFTAEAWRQFNALDKQVGLFGDGSDAFRRAGGLLAGLFTGGGPPPRRGTWELIRAYKKMPWLRAVNSKVSASIASVTWELYVQRSGIGNGRAFSPTGGAGKVIRNAKLQRADAKFRRKEIKRLKTAGELQEITSHPFLDLIDNANPAMTGRAARMVTQIYLDIKGEAFWVLERNSNGMPIEYWPVPPHWIAEPPSSGKPYYRVSWRGWQGPIPETEIVWLKDVDPENPYGRGTGIAEALSDELETDEYAAKFLKSFFYNRATPDLLVGVDGADEAELTRAKQKWEDQHRGFWRAFRSHWHSGKLDVKQLGYNFQQLQLTKLREHERNTIINVYGVSPEIFGIVENSNRATIDAANFLYAQWVLVPRLEFLRSEMQERLVPQFDERLILDYVSPVPEDREFYLQAAEKAPWSRTRNEWREMQELEPDEVGGDYYYVPIGLLPERQGEEPDTGRLEDEGGDGDGGGNSPGAEPPEAPQQDSLQQDSAAATQSKKKALRQEDVENIMERLRPERLTAQLDPVFQKLLQKWGSRVLAELGIDSAFSMLNPLVGNHLVNLRENKIKGLVNETTKKRLRNSLLEGVRAGEGIPDLAKRVSTIFAEAKGPRSTVIARTEVLNSSNFATWSAHQQSGVVNIREWLATKDERVRDAHAAMDGQRRGINDPFTAPGGATAMYPGDFGIAELDIQCRCTTIPVIADPGDSNENSAAPKKFKQYSEEQRIALWKVFDREIIPWERRVAAACKKGFQQQEYDVMNALNNFREE